MLQILFTCCEVNQMDLAFIAKEKEINQSAAHITGGYFSNQSDSQDQALVAEEESNVVLTYV